MSYPVSIMIGVCVGDVFSGVHTKRSKESLQNKILNIVKKIILEKTLNDFGEYPEKTSDILSGRKGDYIVIAGVYNTFGFETASLIAQTISKELKCETMIMAYDMIGQKIECMVYSNGEPKSNKPIWGYED